jgi:hypothetical protein
MVLPPPPTYYGFTGIQTNIGESINSVTNPLQLPQYGMQLLNSNNYGRFVRLGDYGGNNSSSILTWSQPLGQALTRFYLLDNYTFQEYLNIQPSVGIYAISDYSNTGSFYSFTAGMYVSRIDQQGALYLSQGLGFRIDDASKQVWLGQEETGARLGVDYLNTKMFVGDALIEDNGLNQSSKYIRVITSSGQEYWIPLYR